MKVIYIAGKFRGFDAMQVDDNVHSAKQAAFAVAKHGGVPLCPHTMFQAFDRTLTDQFWIDATLELVRRSDAIFVFNPRDAYQSVGTKGELALAAEISKPIFFDLFDVVHWLERTK